MVWEMFLSILTDLAVDPIREYIVAPVKRHVGYAFTYKAHLENLKNQVGKLTVERDNLQLSVTEATRRGDDIRPGVQQWLTNVDGAIERAMDVIRTEDEATMRCCNGWVPNLKKRYQLSKNSEDNAFAIIELQNGSRFDQIYRRPTLKQRGATSVDADEDLDSRSLILEQVMDALADPDINIVGVYGMGGMGKTTLAYKVQSKASGEKSFDLVFMTTVSSTPDLDKIRQQIAELLGLNFEEKTPEGKADRLHQTLMKKNKILLILDDIWQEVSLQIIGIPHGKQHKGCKILLTSRSLNVLLGMNSGRNLNLESLHDGEAWTLFEKMLGGIKNEVQDIAPQVAKKCRGLPLLIATVARALKDKGRNDWKYALRQLSTVDNKDDMQAVVYSALELSYNHLISVEVKSFLLLCAQLGKPEISIDHLFIYSVGLDLLKRGDTMEDGRIIVLKWITDLKASCFLLDSDSLGFVKIHDLVRDVALLIASRDQNVFAIKSDGVSPKEWPKVDELQNCTRISLPLCKDHVLPEILECRKAIFLNLGCEQGSYLKIPDPFFQVAKDLQVLHLSNFCFWYLPASLGSLTNLRTLCLHACRLLDTAIIGKLKKLEILSFRDSKMEELSGEIGDLTGLKLLDLSNCSNLKFIPENVLSRLSLLEELYICIHFDQWGMKKPNNKRNASLVELESLSRLTSLEICVPDAKLIPRGLFSNNLENYKILIGENRRQWGRADGNFSKILMLDLDERIQLVSWVEILLKKAEYLCLDFNAEKGIIKNVLYDLDSEGFPQLKYLHLRNGPKIQYLINSLNGVSCRAAFPILGSLSLVNLTNLEKICHDPCAVGSFSEITIFRVTECHSLKNLFSLSMVSAISKLRELGVRECNNMEFIVAVENEDEDKEGAVFAHLRILELYNLPQLRSFCSGVSQTRQDQLTKDAGFNEIVSEVELGTSPSLFNEMVAFPVIEEIGIGDIVNLKKIWQSPLATGSFGKLKSVAVENCEKLETVFPFNVMETFQLLERLVIHSCDSVQEIYQLQEEKPADAAFQLKALDIQNLPKLKHVWSKDPQGTITFQNLQSVLIFNCEILENLFPESIACGLLKLQKIYIINCKMIEKIIQSEQAEGTTEQQIIFPCSNYIHLSQLPKLSCFYSGNIRQIIFPSLNYIGLSELPKLSSFYSGSGSLYCPSLTRIQISGLPWDSSHPRIEEKESKQRVGDEQLQMPIAPFFSHKVAPKLEELVSDNKAMEMILQCQLTEEFISMIKVVQIADVRSFSSQQNSTICVSDFLKRLHNLEKLHLSNYAVKQLFGHDGGKEEKTTLPQLRILELDSLKYLKHIWKQDSQQLVHHLETLRVSSCCNLINLAPSSAFFRNLTFLNVSYCGGLTNLVTASVARSMVQLVAMSVTSCRKLTEIVGNEEGGNTEEIIFSKLKTLEFYDLDHLESFSSGSYSFRFPSLEQVTMDGCPKMRIFCHQELTTPKLKSIVTNAFPGEWYWEGNLNATIQHMYSEMIGLGSKYYLKLSEHTQLKEKWNSELPFYFLGSVQDLAVDNCSSSSTAVPSNVLHFLNDLWYLTVEKCGSVEHIFDLKGLNFDEVVRLRVMTSLTRLHLIDLPKLKHAFTLFMALGLVRLEFMEINGCISLESIINKEENEEEAAVLDRTRIFPRLGSIKLERLPALTSFYLGSGVIECPSLKEIDVVHCPKMKIFDSFEESKEEAVQVESQFVVPHFFNARVGVPRLEELGVEWVVMKEMWHKNYKALSRLKVIKLRCCAGEYCELHPSDFFQKLSNLEELVVSDAFADKVSVQEERNMTNLKHMLEMISRPSTYFQNVTKLAISECHWLVYVIPSSTAKSLAQLKSLIIEKCETLQEIVASDEDGGEDEICFGQLCSLRLSFLPCLTNFCSNNYAFNFPSLERATIEECPKMKFFVQGVLSTPKLERIELDNDPYWKCSLDSTVRELAKMM